MKKLTFQNLKPSEYNPRKIEGDNFDGLKKSLDSFGDIAGVTFNLESKRLVTGHQRVEAFKDFGDQLVEVEILKKYDEPTKKGYLVLDVFGGSGSTLLACEQLGRKSRIIELDPFYVSAAIERWENLTGEKHKRI